jgi:hypothetical protein
MGNPSILWAKPLTTWIVLLTLLCTSVLCAHKTCIFARREWLGSRAALTTNNTIDVAGEQVQQEVSLKLHFHYH